MNLRTPRVAPRVPVARWALSVAAVAAAAIVLYDVLWILRLRGRRTARRDPLVHDGLVGPAGPAPLRLVVLGDSAAAGYGLDDPDRAYPRQVASRLAERSGRPVELVSFAEDGARLHDLATVQAPRLPADTDVVVLAAGVNDTLARRSAAAVEADTRGLVVAVRDAAPAAEIVVVGCPDLATAPGFPWPLNRIVGWACRRTCDAQERACAATGVTFVRYPEPPGRDLYGPDGFHPGAAGQAAAATATAAHVRAG